MPNQTPDTPILFYRAAGINGYMSNLFKRAFTFEGREFRSREDAYQYGKPTDPKVAEWLIQAPKPHLCAAAAHGLFSFDIRADWHQIKVERMTAINRAFFRQHPDLAAALQTTGDAELQEDSKSDAFWGIGPKGIGRNMQGRILMQIRAELRGGPEATPATPDGPAHKSRRREDPQ